MCSCAAEETRQVATDSTHELRSKLLVGSNFALDGHEFLEYILSRENEVSNDVVGFVEEESKDDFVATQHCEDVHKGEKQGDPRKLHGLLCFCHG